MQAVFWFPGRKTEKAHASLSFGGKKEEKRTLREPWLRTERDNIQSGGFYYQAKNGTIQHSQVSKASLTDLNADPKLEEMASFTALEYRILGANRWSPQNVPKTLIVGNLHPDEYETPQLWWEHVSGQLELPRIEVLNAFLAESNTKQRTVIRDGKTVNLNRQFFATNRVKTWEDLHQKAQQPEVRFFYQLLAQNPQLETVFTFHEDGDFSGDEYDQDRGGFYLYYTRQDAQKDRAKKRVLELAEKLMAKVKAAGIAINSGVDDPTDPVLNMVAENGFIDQPLVDRQNKMKLDGTLEAITVFTGKKGLTNIQRSICFEIPAKLSAKRKVLLLNLIRTEFIEPFYDVEEKTTFSDKISASLLGWKQKMYLPPPSPESSAVLK